MASLIVLGLDGASWNLLEPWMEEGHLPNLEKICNEGKKASMESCLPYVTFPAWRTMTSGTNPGDHGVFWWMQPDFSKNTIVPNNSKSFATDDVWDTLNEHGITTGIINVPGTFPPDDVDGFMVSGAICEEDDAFTRPKELKAKILEKGYRIGNDTAFHEDEQEAFDNIEKAIKAKFDLTIEKAEDVDFLWTTIFQIDNVQHYYWDDEKTLEQWKLIDEQLGRLRAETSADLLIVSDHGFQPMDKKFHINQWLIENDYLELEESTTTDASRKIGISRDTLFEIVKRLNLLDVARQLIPEQLRAKIPTSDGLINPLETPEKIKWSDISAIATGEGPVFCKKDAEKIADQLERHDAVKNIYRKEDIYQGKRMDEAPALVVDPEPGYEIVASTGSQIVTESSDWVANHHRDGIVILDAKEGKATLEDNPTIYAIRPLIESFFDIERGNPE